jgi:hypothetical protein
MTTALIIKTDDTLEDFDGPLEFSTIKPITGIGTIQYIYNLDHGIMAMVDDEGMFNGSKPNHAATAILDELNFPMNQLPAGAILGNVLFFGGIDGEYEAPLSEAQDAELREIFDNVSHD